MSPTRFDRFCLDPLDRRLTRDGETVEISGRYLDALALLVAERGRLVTKDRFMAEVWKGVPVTDEALTQCVRSLRRELGDDAARPRFIETVPRHGYRFIAAVVEGPAEAGAETTVASAPAPRVPAWRRAAPDAAAGMTGGGAAGAIGGLIYGLAASASGMGAASTLLVLACGATLLALTAGAAVGLGVGLGREVIRRGAVGLVSGGALAGLLVGGVVKLIGVDAFRLLTGSAPGDMTGAGEGLVLGAAVGLGAWLAGRGGVSGRLGAAQAGAVGAVAGVVIALAGGRLLGGSLDALVRGFPEAPLSLAPLGRLAGEAGFGPVTQMVTAGLEGALFAACVVAAMTLIRRDGAAGRGSA